MTNKKTPFAGFGSLEPETSSWKSGLIAAITVATLLFGLTGCGLIGSNNSADSQKLALNAPAGELAVAVTPANGSLIIARPIPAINVSATDSYAGPIFGFLSAPLSVVGEWVNVDREQGKLTLMSGSREVYTTSAEGIEHLKSGVYNVIHKQKSPLWYAPDQYFIERNLEVPPQGDKLRYRRGALGQFAIFINQDTPIHSGPIWLEEIGGLKLKDSELSRLYYALDVGAVVTVK